MISKLFWALVIAAAVVLLVPPVRERVWPKLQPAFDPLYEWNAKNEVNGLRDVVKRADATGRTIPTDERFSAFVNSEAMEQNASNDSWGTPFYITVSGNTFQVGSAGRDRQPGTADDILSAPEVLTHPPEGRRF